MKPTIPDNFSSVMAHPMISFEVSPKIGQPDPHMAQANSDVASVASVASDLLQQVVREELDVISDPASPAEAVQRARARILSAVSVVNSASNAVTGVAEAEAAQAGQVIAITSENVDALSQFHESSPGARDSNSDRLAEFLNVQFNSARQNMLDAASGMEADPALPEVLKRRREPGGVAGFFKRVSSAAVALSALGSRALAIPGMVRQSISNGLDRADDAVQDALDRWHGNFGKAVDALRDEARARVDSVIDASREISQWSKDKAADMAQATIRGVEAVSGKVRDTAQGVANAARTGVENVIDAADQNIVAPTVHGAVALGALGKVSSQRITSAISGFLNDRALPALSRFVNDVGAEMENMTPQGYKRSTISRTSFNYAQDAYAHMDPSPEFRESRGVKGP